MGLEIERKFLTTSDAWRLGATGETYCQGYFSQHPSPTVRVRTEGKKAFLTIKGKTENLSLHATDAANGGSVSALPSSSSNWLAPARLVLAGCLTAVDPAVAMPHVCNDTLNYCTPTTPRTESALAPLKNSSTGIVRAEFEYEIPFDEAQELQRLCITPLVIKTRYKILHEGMTWEVDEFHAENEGLIVAEIELDKPDAIIKLPSWIGKDVSDDPRYCNSNLSIHPFTKWVQIDEEN